MPKQSYFRLAPAVVTRLETLAAKRGMSKTGVITMLVYDATSEQQPAAPPRASAQLLKDYRYAKGILQARLERNPGAPSGYRHAVQRMLDWVEQAFQERRAAALARVAANNPWSVLFAEREAEWAWELDETGAWKTPAVV